MSNPKQDIFLIRKYHNGELSSAEKNQLEARALDDPFLQDALDGYESFGEKEDDLALLTQKINERIAPAKVITPVWGLKQWGIAASVVFCIALASIYLNQTPKGKTIALNDLQQKEDIPQAEKSKIAPTNDSIELSISPNSVQPAKLAENNVSLNKTESYTQEPDIIVEPLASGLTNKNTFTDVEEVAVVDYPTQKKQDAAAALSSMDSQNLMASRTAMPGKQLAAVKLKGKIVDENHMGLPGVSVKNLSTGEGKATDVNGEFTIAASKNDELAITYLGFDAKNKTIEKTDDSLLIELSPATSSLSEVVTVGYRAATKNTNQIAEPKVGWKSFKQYLQEQANIANIGRGKVQVQFIISTNGELSDFKIIETFSEKAGVAAINIIKNYNGGWLGSTEKIAHKANITIKFK